MTLGKSINSIRTDRGLNQRVFGKQLGLTHAAISQYETGKVVPGGPVLLALLDLANSDQRVPIVEALGGDDPEEFARQINEVVKPFLESDDPNAKESVEAGVRDFIAAALVPILTEGTTEPATERLLHEFLQHGTDPEYQQHFLSAYTAFEKSRNPDEDEEYWNNIFWEFNQMADDFSKRMIKSGMKDAIKIARMRQEEAAEQDEESKAG